MTRILSFFSRKAVYIPIIILALMAGGIFIAKYKNRPEYVAVAAAKQDFVQVITANGKVVPADDVDLNFETSGRVGRVNVKVGDTVKRGKLLATLGSGDEYASLLGAQARLESEQIKLRDLQAGNRPEEIQIKKTALNNAKIAKAQAEDSLKNSIIEAYVASEDLIHADIDQIFHRNASDEKNDIIPFQNPSLEKSLNDQKDDIDDMLKNWQLSINTLISGNYSSSKLTEALNNLSTLRAFLSDLSLGVSQLTPLPDLSQATIEQYKSAVSSSRVTINSKISLLNTQQDALQTADLNITTAEDNLALSEAGANPFDIQAQQAAVKSAQANVLQAQSALSKTAITSPFDGVITKVNITAGGGISSLSTSAISLISAAEFEIESFVPEADIAKIHINDNANVTLDAYGGNTVFEAVITKIDPAETVIDGVSTYRTVLQFKSQDERIKSGMTANIDIQGQIRNDVLVIPQSSIIYDDKNNKTVYILKGPDNQTEVRSIKTGQTDDKGNVEVIEGLTEGEMVVTNPPRK